MANSKWYGIWDKGKTAMIHDPDLVRTLRWIAGGKRSINIPGSGIARVLTDEEVSARSSARTDPLLVTAGWTTFNPDIVAVRGTDPAAGAGLIHVKSLAADGEEMMIQLNFIGDVGGVAFSHTVAAGDTREIVATHIANQIRDNALCAAHNISVQHTAGPGAIVIGVTNFLDNLVGVSAQRHPECFDTHNGEAVLDAGPCVAITRAPAGFAPPIGSNIGQFIFGAPAANTPGDASVQYITIGVQIVNNDPNDLRGEAGIWSAETISGFFGTRKRAGISRGLYLFGPKGEQAFDMGSGTINLPRGCYYYADSVPQGKWLPYTCNIQRYRDGPFVGGFRVNWVNANFSLVGDVCNVNIRCEIFDTSPAPTDFIVGSLPFNAALVSFIGGRQEFSPGGNLQGKVGDPPNLWSLQDRNNQYAGPPPGVAGVIVASATYAILP